MIFGSKHTSEKFILRLGVSINLEALPEWLRSKKTEIPAHPYTEWSRCNNYEYLIFILPVSKNTDWYFHKNSSEFSHSISAIINIEDKFHKNTDIQSCCEGMAPDLEIEIWNDQLSIAFCSRLIMMAPLTEGVSIMNKGKTTLGTLRHQEQEINVPVAFNDKGEPTEFIAIHQWINSRGVSYSNQLANVWMDSPKRLVVN